MLFLARRKNKVNQLGYLLETAKEIFLQNPKKNRGKTSEIGKALKWLGFFKSESEGPLIEGIKTHKKQDRISQKWNVKTNYSFEDFKRRMREYNAD